MRYYASSFIQNPYPIYASQLSSHGPIYWDDTHHVWYVMGHALACTSLTDARLSSNTSHYLLDTTFPRQHRIKVQPLIDYFKQWLFYQDPPDHTVLRKQISPIFSTQTITLFDPIVREIVQSVCEPLKGEFDFVSEVAAVISGKVNARFLSLPEEDAATYVRWTLMLSNFMEMQIRTPHEYGPALIAYQEQKEYFSTLAPQLLPNAHWTLLPMLLGTGIETTLTFLASGLQVLLTHLKSWQQLQREPSLLEQTIDELLRFEPPVHKTVRQAIMDVDYESALIKKGDMVTILLASANRDPAIFSDPHTFDITRASHVNLSFGYGIHYCLGRLLGRLVARHCFQYMLTSWPHIRLVNDTPSWHMGTMLRRLKTLSVCV